MQNSTSRIIIIGANFSGLAAASKIDKHLNVTVIDQSAFFQWTPNIHEILSDVKTSESVQLDLKQLIGRMGHTFVQETVIRVEGKKQHVVLSNSEVIEYDVLLICSGQGRANFDVEGASEFARGFRTAEDVSYINDAINSSLSEQFNSPENPVNVSVVGGGFTGVEVLGELLRKYANNDKLQFNVIDASSHLVGNLPSKLSDEIIHNCKDFSVNFLLEHKISTVSKSHISFEDKPDIASDITIWSAGTELPSYLSNLDTPNSNKGLEVNECLQTFGYPNIFVAGDCASPPINIPKQASNAMDMGIHAARNINKWAAGQALSTFTPRQKPVLLTLGDINTYFIYDDLVLASPLLAAAKESVYQLYMAKLSALLPIEQSAFSLFKRFAMATEKLLLVEILKFRPKVILKQSKII